MPKLVGTRHIVQSEPDNRFLLQPEFLPGISLLEEFDLAYDILIYNKHLPVAAEFVGCPARAFCPRSPCQAAGQKRDHRFLEAQGIKRLTAFLNVFCKLSGLVTEADWQHWKPEHVVPFLDVAFESFGRIGL